AAHWDQTSALKYQKSNTYFLSLQLRSFKPAHLSGLSRTGFVHSMCQGAEFLQAFFLTLIDESSSINEFG
ncbi:MAG: hypothetical protein ACRDCV_14305, partial [Plesiomonas shigelloides]